MQVLSLALLHMVKPLGLSDGVVYANVADKHDKGKDKDAEKKIGEKQTSEKLAKELVSVCVNIPGLFSHYDLIFLSMSVMAFQKSVDGG